MPTPSSIFDIKDVTRELKRRSVVGLMATFGTQGCSFVLTVAATIVLARILSPDDFGLLGMVALLNGFALLCADSGLSSATIQREDLHPEDVSNLFWVNVGMSLVAGLTASALSVVFVWFFGRPELYGIILGFAGCYLFGGLGVQHGALLRRQMRFIENGFIQLAAQVAGMACAILFALQGAGYWALVLRMYAILITRTLLLWIVVRWVPRFPGRGHDTPAMLRFGFHVLGSNVLGKLRSGLDLMLLGKFFGAVETGLYDRASALMYRPLTQLNTPMQQVALPAFSRLASRPETLRRLFLGIFELFLILFPLFAALCIVLAREIIVQTLGPAYVDAAPLFAALSIMTCVVPASGSCSWLLIAMGHTALLVRFQSLNFALILLSYLMGIYWGAHGVALSFALVGLLLRSPILYWWVGGLSGFSRSELLLPFVRGLALAAGYGACLWGLDRILLPGQPAWMLSLAVVLFVALAAWRILRSPALCELLRGLRSRPKIL